MRDINEICTEVAELDYPLTWDEATRETALEVDYPFTAADFEAVLRDRKPRVCYEGIQATLCPLEIAGRQEVEGHLALVADGYVYEVHSGAEVEAVEQA